MEKLSPPALPTVALVQDPEGLFSRSVPQSGLIERKMMQQRISTDQEYNRQVAAFQQQQRVELQAKREVRLRMPAATPHGHALAWT